MVFTGEESGILVLEGFYPVLSLFLVLSYQKEVTALRVQGGGFEGLTYLQHCILYNTVLLRHGCKEVHARAPHSYGYSVC